MPHSNFHPELEISDDGRGIKMAGPMEDVDDDVVGIVVWALVTQKPEHRNPAAGRPAGRDRHGQRRARSRHARADR